MWSRNERVWKKADATIVHRTNDTTGPISVALSVPSGLFPVTSLSVWTRPSTRAGAKAPNRHLL
ncbi:hypothetical protein [Streptomyces sp. NPDC096323]|uniref:hypothetical protein n=1 Tax=Streptomyces sp. NPDC096323 TaxID=3155822 RepID=UPI00332D0A2E